MAPIAVSTGRVRAALAVLASTLWLFISGALVYVVLLADTLPPLLHEIARSDAEMKARLWAVALEKAFTSLGLVLVALRLPAQSWWRGSAWLGGVAAAMFLLPFALSVFANYRVPGTAAVWMTLEGSIRLFVAAAIVMAITRSASNGSTDTSSRIVQSPQKELRGKSGS